MPRPLCLLSQGEMTRRPPAVLHLAQGSSPTEGTGCSPDFRPETQPGAAGKDPSPLDDTLSGPTRHLVASAGTLACSRRPPPVTAP